MINERWRMMKYCQSSFFLPLTFLYKYLYFLFKVACTESYCSGSIDLNLTGLHPVHPVGLSIDTHASCSDRKGGSEGHSAVYIRLCGVWRKTRDMSAQWGEHTSFTWSMNGWSLIVFNFLVLCEVSLAQKQQEKHQYFIHLLFTFDKGNIFFLLLK